MEKLQRMVSFPLIDEQEGEVEGIGVLIDLKIGRIRPCHLKKKILELDPMTVTLLVLVSLMLLLCFMLYLFNWTVCILFQSDFMVV